MNIIKIILIILGILLGLLLFLVLSVLFIPLRYKATGEFRQETYVKAKVSWFLSALGVHFLYDTDQRIRVWLRIFFWKRILYESEEDENSSGEVDSIKKNSIEDAQKIEQREDSKKPEQREDSQQSEQREDSQEPERTKDSRKKRDSGEEPSSGKNRKGKPGENIKRMIDRIKAFRYDDRDKAALSHIKEELILLLKHLCPVKSRLELEYSTGSPDTTGISLGVIAMFPLAYKNHWNIVPDFEAEEAYAKGSGWLKGRIYVYYLLLILLRLYRDKNCYRLYRKIKRF